ncbi:MAG: hypothetical protein M1826_004557 [Phylliscum demangeonii]|nr:MAG: hypothetical protein M1826_004557 [Phylliscum demangeonii]
MLSFASFVVVVITLVKPSLVLASSVQSPSTGSVTTTTYSYPRTVDPIIFNVASNATNATIATVPPTQIQGRFYFPTVADQPKGSVPLIILLPGRHAGCRQQVPIPGLGFYPFDNGPVDDQGRCPDNQTVIRSDIGFDYLGQDLAAHGYAVISMDPLTVNSLDPRPDDPFLNRARARLLFRTAEKAQEWNVNARTSMDVLGINLSGTLDFSNIGLMGHSRGGAGVRLAYNFLHPSPAFTVQEEVYNWRERLAIDIRAVMEVAPLDLPDRGTLFNVTGVPWALLAAGCEDDEVDLEYVSMLPRQALQNRQPNHFIMVYGANHGFFNSEWHLVLDTCEGDQTVTWDTNVPTFPFRFLDRTADITFTVPFVQEAPRQRAVALWAVSTFMRSYVGRNADARLARAFDPATPLPIDLLVNGTEIGRANVNLARSRLLSSGPLVNDSIFVIPPARAIQSLEERAQAALAIVAEQSHDGTKLPPDMLTPPGKRLRLAALPSSYDAVAIELSSANSEIHIPIGPGLAASSSRSGRGRGRGRCSINVDVARRDNCYWAESGNVTSTQRKTCSKPGEVMVQVQAGSSSSARIGFKSRFNIEIGPSFSTTDPASDVGFLPIAWETISLPCPPKSEVDRVNEICLVVSSDEDDAGAGSAPGNGSGPSSILYVGPIRLV